MARLLTLPLARIEDATGAPVANARLDVFETGTTTPATVYSDSALTTAHANPIVADAGGLLPEIFLDPSTVYRFRARTAGGTNIAGMDFDPVAPQDAAEISYSASATGAVARSVESKLDEVFSVKDFGAKGDGVTNDTDAFAAASAAITAADGGTLTIPPGTYIVGRQTPATAYDQGAAYFAHDIIKIENCTRPVRIVGNGAFLKAAAGLKFGAFNPATGAAIAGPSVDPDEQAHAYGFVFVNACTAAVEIEGLDIHGNRQAFDLGGLWGDMGRQCGAYGMLLRGNTGGVTVRNCRTLYCGLDGIAVEHSGLTVASPAYPVLIENCESSDNGRQGLGWYGGTQLTAIGCKFNRQGRTAFQSSPSAGVDIEAEDSILRNGLFVNCEFADNVGHGVVADSGDGADMTFIDCTFIGTDAEPMWIRKPGFRFHGCAVLGMVRRLSNNTDPAKATRFYGGEFSLDSTRSPTGSLYGQADAVADLTPGSQNVLFDGVHFDTGASTTAQLLINASGATVRDCTFRHGGTSATTVDVTWEGTNQVTTAAGVTVNGIRRGPVIRNGVVLDLPELTVSGGTFSAAQAGQGKMQGLTASGLALFGRGTVADVNLCNYQGATALLVPTGTIDVKFYGKLLVNDLSKIADFADDTAAAAGGVAVNQVYRSGSTLKIRVA